MMFKTGVESENELTKFVTGKDDIGVGGTTMPLMRTTVHLSDNNELYLYLSRLSNAK